MARLETSDLKPETPRLETSDLKPETPPVGVLLMSFGTAETLEDIPAYLAHVRGGRTVPEELIAEFRRRFEQVGGSPLTRITREQAALLEQRLNEARGVRREARGRPSRLTPPASALSTQPLALVRVGMQHARPFIAVGLAELRDGGAADILAIILSPQFSPAIMGGYLEAVAASEESLGLARPVRVVGPWHRAPALFDAFADGVRAGLDGLPLAERETAPVVFTAHSLPRRVAEGEPKYIQQLRDTADEVAARAGLPRERWTVAYQSAGHTPEEWLKPDLADLFPQFRAAGHRSILVAPIQFVADHLEVLYDVDVAARQQAAAQGLTLVRTESLNTTPLFIEALAWVVERELKGHRRRIIG